MIFLQTLYKNRFFILFLALILTIFIAFSVVIWFKYDYWGSGFPIYSYYDGWSLFTWEFKRSFLYPGYTLFSDSRYEGFQLVNYWHAGCPLYPVVAAGVSIIAGNVIASMIITSALISLIGVYFIKKIAKEYMDYTDAQSYQLISIFVSFNVVAHFFYVPLPISITITMPIIGTYYFLRFFNSPSLKNGGFLTFVFTLTLFTRELLFPFLLLPLSTLILLKIKGAIQRKPYDLNFKHPFGVLLLTTFLIPCGIYSIYLFATGTYASLISSWEKLLCDKAVLWFIYSTFNTITFNWIFVLFCFIAFSLGLVRYFRKSSNCDDLTTVNHARINKLNNGDPSKRSVLLRDLVDFTNGTWAAFIILSRIFIRGCPIEAYFLPWSFSFAVYVFKGTQIVSNPRIRECLFWLAVAANVVVLATQVFPFYPFFDSDISGFIPEWIRMGIGWPFYP